MDLNNVTAATFTLRARPKGAMAGDTCGTLTLNQAGVKGAGGDVGECWGL
ncbi:MAG: type IV pilin protein [Marinobacterium sp.]